jgi:hypothetical protein
LRWPRRRNLTAGDLGLNVHSPCARRRKAQFAFAIAKLAKCDGSDFPASPLAQYPCLAATRNPDAKPWHQRVELFKTLA